MSAVLGPLPLAQLPESKPVTPYGFISVNAQQRTPIPCPDSEMPPWALAVAESHPRGPTGRVGAGHNARASPEMRPGSHHDDWAATPQAALSH